MPEPLTAPLLRVRDLSVSFPDAGTPAPRDVSFDVHPGEVVLVLGPSGSGKSTLALTLNGLIPHDVPATVNGAVEVCGILAADSTPGALSAHVGMVFQDPDAQLVTGTVLEEVAFGPENLLMSVDEVLTRSHEALRRVGLAGREADNPDRLSGGGRQRLAIAAALAMGSPLLVLDEPTANLDPQGIDEVYAVLREVAASDRAIVLVEHNLDAAVELATRVIVLDADGRIIADGPVGTVLRDEARRLAALGVWLPVSTLAAMRLQDAGYPIDPLPLTPTELRTALDAASGPKTPGRASGPPVPERPSSSGSIAPPLVSVRGLRIRRGRTEVLHGIDLDIESGSFVAVVGSNGAGKTTLLQAMAGVIRPPRGAVRIGGIDVSRLDARTRARTVGFVFQNPEHQFVAHTVRDELRFGGMPEADVDAMLTRFGLTDRADLHPFLLSGGQKRRLSVGTALIAGAPLLALDEPTYGQDRARAAELLDILTDLNTQGTTVVIVTHDMQLVADHAHRMVVVDGGRIAGDGTPARVFADDALLARTGLRPPPLRRAFADLTRHPELAGATRLADLPGGLL